MRIGILREKEEEIFNSLARSKVTVIQLKLDKSTRIFKEPI